MEDQKRFRVALSFPGEHRAFVEKAAAVLAANLGQERVLYDKYHEPEFARPELDVYLPNLYQTESELIVLFLCAEYAKKRWCKLEWRSIRQLICTSDSSRIMFVSFDDIGPVPDIGIMSGDGYASIGDRTPEEVASLILERLRVNAGRPRTTTPLPVTPEKESRSLDYDSAIEASGSWCLLSNRFYTAQNVRHNSDGSITVRIASTDAESDAAIRSLRPTGSGQPPTAAFAYRNDACFALVKNLEAESKGDDTIWILTLRPAEFSGGILSEIAYGGEKPLSVDDIAKMRTSRILLNDPPEAEEGKPGSGAPRDGMVEVLIRGIHTPLQAKLCVLRSLYPSLKENPKLFLQLARLSSIFALKESCAVEHVLQLALGPLKNGIVHVRFRGVRRKMYSNVEATAIALEGDCAVA